MTHMTDLCTVHCSDARHACACTRQDQNLSYCAARRADLLRLGAGACFVSVSSGTRRHESTEEAVMCTLQWLLLCSFSQVLGASQDFSMKAAAPCVGAQTAIKMPPTLHRAAASTNLIWFEARAQDVIGRLVV